MRKGYQILFVWMLSCVIEQEAEKLGLSFRPHLAGDILAHRSRFAGDGKDGGAFVLCNLSSSVFPLLKAPFYPSHWMSSAMPSH
jgi:hypothetical protein